MVSMQTKQKRPSGQRTPKTKTITAIIIKLMVKNFEFFYDYFYHYYSF